MTARNYVASVYLAFLRNVNSRASITSPINEKLNKMSAPLVFHSLQPILDEFQKHKTCENVKELLKIYNEAIEELKKSEATGETKRYPLIVLEGLDGCGKSTVGYRLAKKINAVQWRTPPNSVANLRASFDEHILRTAFYSLGNYIAGLEVQTILKKQPVVMDRYWHSTCAFAVAQAVTDFPETYIMPPENDKIYCWPEDLFKPDKVILLNVSEHIRLERHSRRKTSTSQEDLLKNDANFRKNVIMAYKNMYNPGVDIVNGDGAFKEVLSQIDEKIKHLA